MNLNELDQIKQRLKRAGTYFTERFNTDTPEGKEWAKKEFETLVDKANKLWSQVLISDRLKHEKIYEDILADIVSIRKAIGIDSFDFQTALKHMIAATRWLSLNFSWDNWGNGIEAYLKKHEPLENLLREADEVVERAFRLESMWLVQDAIEKYKNAYASVNRIYNSKEAKLGFREMLPDEEEFNNPFNKV